jgi:chemotaxis protein MotA
LNLKKWYKGELVMDLGLIIGFASGLIFIFLSILLNAGMDIGGVLSFLDAPSAMVTFGGAIASTAISYPMPQLVKALKCFGVAAKPTQQDPIGIIKVIIDMANLARKEGILALEDAAGETGDAFLQKGIMLVVDGTDPELVRGIMETEISNIESRHKEVIAVWETMASLGPAWGMIGTLIGLVMMLQNLSDPSSIGPSMAVALITTFYGSVFANYVCTPIATKLKVFSEQELQIKEILIEGVLSISAGENPRIIEEKLKVFIAPALRDNVGGEKKGDE